MSDYKQRLDSIMLQLQDIIEEGYEDNEYVQTQFNNLACILDDIIPQTDNE
jgi:hypothetical protein